MENGLSSNRVYSIVQDSLGFIWFGTNDGLNRFDGLDFRKYYYTGEDGDGMSSNSVRWLLISRDNRMWIALDNGVDVYDPQTAFSAISTSGPIRVKPSAAGCCVLPRTRTVNCGSGR